MKKRENVSKPKKAMPKDVAEAAAAIRQHLLSLETRQYLLARVAGDVASGIVCAPSESTSTAEAIAAV